MIQINDYFDNVYVLNLKKRKERRSLMKKRLDFTDIEHEFFDAIDGSVMEPIWNSFCNPNFKNSNYLACTLSHLSIYEHALKMNYSRILILEDDCRIHRNANMVFDDCVPALSSTWNLLYLGFIPLSDDCTRWDYNVFDISNKIGHAKNFWGLYSYGIRSDLMMRILDEYKKNFPMELDRYFVTKIQPEKKSYGFLPQLFAADDGFSDNSKIVETGMLQRSIDSRFGNMLDYV